LRIGVAEEIGVAMEWSRGFVWGVLAVWTDRQNCHSAVLSSLQRIALDGAESGMVRTAAAERGLHQRGRGPKRAQR
jgi:hypothetical protein